MKLPRLSLRDLIWLVLVAAIGCAWWIDRRTQNQRTAHWRAEAIKAMAWVDQNCSWIEVGLSDEDEILFLRKATQEEEEDMFRELRDKP